nr:hypothetical protein [Desertimonas flava]
MSDHPIVGQRRPDGCELAKRREAVPRNQESNALVIRPVSGDVLTSCGWRCFGQVGADKAPNQTGLCQSCRFGSLAELLSFVLGEPNEDRPVLELPFCCGHVVTFRVEEPISISPPCTAATAGTQKHPKEV